MEILDEVLACQTPDDPLCDPLATFSHVSEFGEGNQGLSP
jgi:hypothetical protein